AAVDVDPIAVGAARENLEHNGVRSVEVSDGAVPDGPFDLVLANIQADVLEELRETLASRLAPGGAIVLSGLLTPQAEPLAAGYERAGLRRLRARVLDEDPDWTAVVLERP